MPSIFSINYISVKFINFVNTYFFMHQIMPLQIGHHPKMFDHLPNQIRISLFNYVTHQTVVPGHRPNWISLWMKRVNMKFLTYITTYNLRFCVSPLFQIFTWQLIEKRDVGDFWDRTRLHSSVKVRDPYLFM